MKTMRKCVEEDDQAKNHQALIKLRADVRDRDRIIAEQAIRLSQLETENSAYRLLVDERGRTIKELRGVLDKQE